MGSTSRHGASNRFMRSGKYIRFSDWRFVHRARLDVLPLNRARRWGSGARRFRRCGYASETLPHLIFYCGPLSAACQFRHNAMREACRGLQAPWRCAVEPARPGRGRRSRGPGTFMSSMSLESDSTRCSTQPRRQRLLLRARPR